MGKNVVSDEEGEENRYFHPKNCCNFVNSLTHLLFVVWFVVFVDEVELEDEDEREPVDGDKIGRDDDEEEDGLH
jgi:hypothetical protein